MVPSCHARYPGSERPIRIQHLRHQLPVYSPVGRRSLVAAVTTLLSGEDRRPELVAALLADYASVEAVLLGSGTQALQYAIELGLRTTRNSVVALPAFACFDLVSAAVGANATVTFYDVDPLYLTPDWDSLERVLKDRVGIVVVAPLYGIPLDIDRARSVTERHGAILIEDSAQGHGARWNGQRLGSFGDASVLSFGRGKGWTGGRGGAALIRAPRLLEVMNSSTAPARERRGGDQKILASTLAQWLVGRPSLYGIPRALPGLGLGETTYHDPLQPELMSTVAAAMALASQSEAELEGEIRRRNAERFIEALQDSTNIHYVPVDEARGTPGYLRLPLRVVNRASSVLRSGNAARLGIAPSYPLPLPHLSQIQPRLSPTSAREFPGADELVRSLLTIPTHSMVSMKDREAILKVLSAQEG